MTANDSQLADVVVDAGGNVVSMRQLPLAVF
jgi:hypothetical protein